MHADATWGIKRDLGKIYNLMLRLTVLSTVSALAAVGGVIYSMIAFARP